MNENCFTLSDLLDALEEINQEDILLETTKVANENGLTLEWFEFCLEHPEYKTWDVKAYHFRKEWDI